MVKENGKQWKEISKILTGRTESMIRNRYYAKLRKIDPETITSMKIDPIFESQQLNQFSSYEHI